MGLRTAVDSLHNQVIRMGTVEKTQQWEGRLTSFRGSSDNSIADRGTIRTLTEVVVLWKKLWNSPREKHGLAEGCRMGSRDIPAHKSPVERLSWCFMGLQKMERVMGIGPT